MVTFKVSDEIYEQLKNFVVDPFDDTPDIVIGRLIEIVNKAKDHWTPFGLCDDSQETEAPANSRPARSKAREEDESMVLL